MAVEVIGRDDAPGLRWDKVMAAIEAGHDQPRAALADTVIRENTRSLLVRSAMIEGLGSLVKAAIVFPDNAQLGVPSINGGAMLYSADTGVPEAVIDFHLLTWWKTAADSLLAATRLAPDPVLRILVIGAGTVARSLVEAFRFQWPDAEISVWSRNASRTQQFADRAGCSFVVDLEDAVPQADIVLTATMSQTPVLKGAWLREGQHINLIGAYRGDMRECDDEALTRSRIYVDSRETVLSHIGELAIPLSDGVIREADVLADFYELHRFERSSGDITLFKNGGGAHLDLMVAREILRERQAHAA